MKKDVAAILAVEAGDEAKRGRLACPCRTKKHCERALGNAKADAVNRRRPAKTLGQATEL
jgi:hypothetical protein